MPRRINTERIERLLNDTGVLSEVVEQLMSELFKSGGNSASVPKKDSPYSSRIAHLFRFDEE